MAAKLSCTYHQLKYSPPNRSKNNNQEPHTKRNLENGPKAEKDKTESAKGLRRRTREEIWKSGVKLTAARFQTRGRHQKSSASLRRNRLHHLSVFIHNTRTYVRTPVPFSQAKGVKCNEEHVFK